jgi:hypothetical protein
MLVRFRNVALAQDQAGHRRNSESERIIEQAAKNEQVEFLGRRADGRDRVTVSVGKISRMTNRFTSRSEGRPPRPGQLASGKDDHADD